MDEDLKENLMNTNDKLISFLNKIIVYSVKSLAIMMVFVIIWALIDVVVDVYLMISLTSRFSTERLISTLGSFLAVLIAIEIFLNIIFYLKKDIIQVSLVLATAITAVARKVIIIDYSVSKASDLYGIAALVIALGLTYWLITKKEES